MKKLKKNIISLVVPILITAPIFVFAESLIKSKEDIMTVAVNLVNWLGNMFWIISVGMMIWIAYKLISAGDDADQIKTAKSMLKYALYAAAVALLATSLDPIVSSVLNTK